MNGVQLSCDSRTDRPKHSGEYDFQWKALRSKKTWLPDQQLSLGFLSIRVTPVSGIQAVSLGAKGIPGLLYRQCFWQRIFGTGSEGAVLR